MEYFYYGIDLGLYLSTYEYDIPIEVYTPKNEKGETKFKAKQGYSIYSLTDIANIQDSIEAGTWTAEPIEIKKQETKQEIIRVEPEEKPGILQKIIKWIKAIFS